MPIANYEGGFSDGITIRGVPISLTHPGKVFWVSNSEVQLPNQQGGSNSNKGTFNSPFLTLTYALSQVKKDRGDVIFIKPGHAENISSATALNIGATAGIDATGADGVAIIGLGRGTKRPTFTFNTANTATIAVAGNNIAFKNCLFVANFLGTASAFTLGAAADFVLEQCEFRDTSAILNFLACVTTTVSVNADRLYIADNVIKSDATTKSVAPIVILGTMTGLTVKGNRVTQTVAQNNVSQLLSHAALVMTDLLVQGNSVYCVNTDTATGAVLVTTSATTGSGIIRDNYVRALDSAAAIMVTATAVQYGLFNNLYTGETTLASGFVLPAIATDA
jgi:hypothetical protein